jgi:fructose/tagatose bisphosphate aldolase
MIFEIARSEIGYTDQEPSEYATSVLSAAISEGYRGPVFLQGDHFQVSASRYASDPKQEIEALKGLIGQALVAGFFNIDVDASTMVDLSKPTALEQQKLNIELSVMFSTLVRELEPKGVTVSIGGEIGEVGGHNSTEEELRAYLDGYDAELKSVAPEGAGLSKISVQTGTSHGGVVLPDGSIAKVRVDFDTLRQLSRVARKDYGLGGTVQHGASTLPEEAFGKFVEYEACEVHLATNFANIFFDLIPLAMKEDMYAYLRERHASARKRGMTDEQFYYQARKNVIGPFKAKSWNLPVSEKAKITSAWEQQFTKLFTLLGANGTRQYIEKFIKPEKIAPNIGDYMDNLKIYQQPHGLAD